MEKNPPAQEEKDVPLNVEQEVERLQHLLTELDTVSATMSSSEDHILKIQEGIRQGEKSMGPKNAWNQGAKRD